MPRALVSYIPLMAIAALGPFFALLLSLPHQVIRRDGVPVKTSKTPNPYQEARRMLSALRRKEVGSWNPHHHRAVLTAS